MRAIRRSYCPRGAAPRVITARIARKKVQYWIYLRAILREIQAGRDTSNHRFSLNFSMFLGLLKKVRIQIFFRKISIFSGRGGHLGFRPFSVSLFKAHKYGDRCIEWCHLVPYDSLGPIGSPTAPIVFVPRALPAAGTARS